jgi:hypothetical protein
MADLLDLLGPALQGPALQQISSAIGADAGQTQTAAQAALPLLLGQLQRNASTPDGAASLHNALERDHAGGSLLDGLGGLLGGGAPGGAAPGGALGGLLGGLLGGGQPPSRATNGAGILGHIFGARQDAAAEGVARASGLDRGQVLKLMMMLAPLVMAALARRKQEAGAGAGDLAGLLGGATQQARRQAPEGLLGALGGLLDRDGDGNVMDDLGGLLGGRR